MSGLFKVVHECNKRVYWPAFKSN